MALTLTQAQNLLDGIVGRNTANSRYLGLSSTQPEPIASGNTQQGESFSGYNITEPSNATSYTRVPLSANEFTAAASGSYVDGIYTVTIQNTKEVHFSEATTRWGYYKYFFITNTGGTSADSKGTVAYIGELDYAKYVPAGTYKDESGQIPEINSENYATYKDLLFVLIDGNYVSCSDREYDEQATYYEAGRGILIEENTVPLVRANKLKISVR